MRRRLAYVFPYEKMNNGVGKKIDGQVAGLGKKFDVMLFSIGYPSIAKKNRVLRILYTHLWFAFRVLWQLRGYDAIYYRYNHKSIVLNMLLGTFYRKKYYVELNSKIREELRLRSHRMEIWMNQIAEAVVYNRAKRVVVITEEMVDYVRSVTNHRPISTYIMPNGYTLSGDTRPFDEKTNPDLARTIEEVESGGKSISVFAGGLFLWHGVDRIITLLSQDPSWCLLIAGNGEEYGNLKRLVEDQQLDEQIKFLGYLNEIELKYVYGKSHIAFGSFALDRNNMTEAAPLKVREYLFYGLPVIIGYKDPLLAMCPNWVFRLNNMDKFTLMANKLKEIRMAQKEKIMEWAWEKLTWTRIMEEVVADE